MWRAMLRAALLLPVALVVLAVLPLLGCAVDDSAHLVDLLDVAPRDLEVGDVVEVLGCDLPAAESRRVTIAFNGELRRPGRSPLGLTGMGVEPDRSTRDKLSFVLTESLLARFCGRGDEAVHTTFFGDVTVTFDGRSPGAPPVTGAVKHVVLDFRPPSMRRVVMAAREAEGARALEFLGIQPAAEATPGPGLRVAAVRSASPAARAGIVAGDLVVTFDGLTVLTAADLVPRSGAGLATIELKRGEAEPLPQQIAVAGFRPSRLSPDMLGAIVILAVAVLLLLVFMAPTAGVITWVERRVAGRMQSRIGPNRAGPQGVIIWLADGIKSFMKEDIVPAETDQVLFRLAPYLVFMGVSATFVVMPFGQYLIAADLDIGILFVIAVTSLVAIGLLTGGWASNNKWSLLGGIRAAAQIVSYEVPAAIAVVCIVTMTGSLRLQDIILAQGGTGGALWELGGWPWYWFVFRNPVTFCLFFLFFTTALAEGNRAPFDMPEAESELVAGYSTEYSGMRYVFFFFAEWANVFVMSGIASALFLGGWQIPGLTPAQQEASLALQLLGAAVFLVKSWLLIFVVIWVRWTLPRVRIDQLMSLCWKWLVPLSFLGFLLTALWVVADPSPRVQLLTGLVTCLVCAALLVHFARRVRYNLRQARVPLHLNPFL
ncbi:MAG: NADH-quinone oxidoreductase subunit NuoH [Deltaproteobacteria bacterium]|nr:NADH-quinone oxidoreductase subunit NuoH [Deltaproteobacteria bacterium]